MRFVAGTRYLDCSRELWNSRSKRFNGSGTSGSLYYTCILSSRSGLNSGPIVFISLRGLPGEGSSRRTHDMRRLIKELGVIGAERRTDLILRLDYVLLWLNQGGGVSLLSVLREYEELLDR